MPLRENDLKYTVLKKLSFDEFEPKTGDEKDVAVLGFYTTTESAANDLYNFLGGSIVENRDLEVSPNPDIDGYYMVFVEIDRSEEMLDNVKMLVNEVEKVSGDLPWQIKTPYIDQPVSLDEAESIIQVDPTNYFTAAEYKERLEAELNKANLESDLEDRNNQIMEFLRNSNLLDVQFNENLITLADARGIEKLEVVGFGHGPDLLKDLNINESAIKLEYDYSLFGKLKHMLGEMKALPIDNYVVIYNPADTNILVTKAC